MAFEELRLAIRSEFESLGLDKDLITHQIVGFGRKGLYGPT